MLEAPGRVLPRPMSLCLAPRGELAFLLDPIGPGTQALAELVPGEAIHIFGPLGNGFRLDVPRPLLVGGGIGVAPFPYLSEALEHPPAVLGFRSEHHAEAAALVPNAEVVIDPVLVTDVLPAGRDVLACGPEPMLEAVRALVLDEQLAGKAQMACDMARVTAAWSKLTVMVVVEGPVLVTLNARPPDALTAGRRARNRRVRDDTVTPEPRSKAAHRS
jgi:NAD(P)H-flavin reductase